MAAAHVILVINAGSSSVKFSVFDAAEAGALDLKQRGSLDGIGSRPSLHVRNGAGETLIEEVYGAAELAHLDGAIQRVLAWLHTCGLNDLYAAGHRVVHGGPGNARPVLIDAQVRDELAALNHLAPLHQPNNLAAIEALRRSYPTLPQVACFDTAFHRTHPEIADRYALPERFHADGVRRYGFHGLSYEYIASVLPSIAPDIAQRRVIVAHLGSGVSLCALRSGHSIDSTMGFTPLDGAPMGTRPGALDPGVVLHLLRHYGYAADALEHLLYHECGLLALSGISNDMRLLVGNAQPRARFAVDYFVYQVAKQIGALAAALGGVDGLVFTAGIGENSPEIRARIIEACAWMGLWIDPTANAAGGPRISAANSAVSAWVIPTNEELMIARHTLGVVRGQG